MGVRALEWFVDPAVFEDLGTAQQNAFTAVDVILTVTVLGGGSEALHKMVTVFTNFMDRKEGEGRNGVMSVAFLEV